MLKKKKYVIVLEAIIIRLFILFTGQRGQRITHTYCLHMVDGVTRPLHNSSFRGLKVLVGWWENFI